MSVLRSEEDGRVHREACTARTTGMSELISERGGDGGVCVGQCAERRPARLHVVEVGREGRDAR